jgi:hypothetical protein
MRELAAARKVSVPRDSCMRARAYTRTFTWSCTPWLNTLVAAPDETASATPCCPCNTPQPLPHCLRQRSDDARADQANGAGGHAVDDSTGKVGFEGGEQISGGPASHPSERPPAPAPNRLRALSCRGLRID